MKIFLETRMQISFHLNKDLLGNMNAYIFHVQNILMYGIHNLSQTFEGKSLDLKPILMQSIPPINVYLWGNKKADKWENKTNRF